MVHTVLLTRLGSATRAWRRSWAVIAVLVAGSLATLAGCGSGGESADASGNDKRGVAALEVEGSLYSPVWSPGEKSIFALSRQGDTGRGQLVKVDVSEGGFNPDTEGPKAIASSQELEGAVGENLALEKNNEPDKIYVPVPGKNQIAVYDKDDLLEVRTFEAGEEPPSRVALDRESGTLFALSESGSTVTAVDVLAEKEVVAQIPANAGEDALIEAGEGNGLWVAAPETVSFYTGPSFGDRASAEGLGASALVADATRPERAYLAEAGDAGRVVALRPGEGGGLEVVAETKINGPVEYLAAEEGRLYAVTPDSVVALDPESLETRASVNFDKSLGQEALKKADPSGVAVGEDNLYLTLQGEPFLVQIEKT